MHRFPALLMSHVQKDVLYKNGSPLSAYENERCRLDVYLPDGEARAWLLWFHGGGLVEGDKNDCSHLALWLTSRGVGVALSNYRLHPTAKYPEYLDDSLAALDWLAHHLEEIGATNRSIFVGGHSAGAYLAALLTLKPQDGKPEIRGVIPMSGQMVTHYTVRAERGLGPNQVTADEAAPIFHVSETAPPFCVLISDNDMPGRLEENAYFVAMMKVVGHQYTDFHVLSERDHSSIGELFGQAEDEASRITLDFINRHT